MTDTEPDRPEAGDASVDSPSDRLLLQRFQDGHSDAPALMYLRYAHRLYSLAEAQSSPDLARRVDPEDIVQSVFRTFFRRASQGHYVVPDGEELWKLLLVIALNKVRAAGAYHRAAKRDVRRTSGGESFARALEAGSGRDEAALGILRMVIDEALECLPAPQRQMVELRIEGHEVAEIARQVSRSKRSVERVLQEFRGRLDTFIHEDE